jgi:hypothetical protein
MGILYLLGGVALGIVILFYVNNLVAIFGRMDWAERRFGPTGTYTAWRLLAVGCMVGGALLYMGKI